MSNNLPHAVAADRDVVFADGNTYHLSPLTLRDWGEIDVWLEDYVKRRAERVYRDAPADVKAEGIRTAYARANRVSFANVDGVGLLTTPEGTARVLWHALRRAHPSLTPEDVKELWNDEVGRKVERMLEAANRIVDPTEAPAVTTPMTK